MPPRSRLAMLRDRIAAIDPPPQVRRWARAAGYPAFAVFVALIAFAAALPDEKVKERLETLLSQDPTPMQPMGLGVDVKAGEMSLSLLRRGIRAENVVLRTRPTRSQDKPARYVLDLVRVNVGLFGLLFQRPTYSFDIEAFRGVIEGAVRVTMTDNHYRIEVHDAELGAVQGLQTALGPPLEGKVDGKLELDAPGRLLANSSGSVEVNIDGASFGDGKAKLSIPGDAFLAQGVTIPKIRLGKVAAIVTIEKGKARLDSFVAHSADVDVTLEGYVDLRDPFPSSSLHLFLRIKLADALLKREPTLELVTGSLGAQGKRADGFIGAQITGSFITPFFQANKNPPPGVTSKHDTGAPAAPATAPPPGAPPAAAPPPPAGPDAAQAPVEIPPPERPQPQPQGGVIPPPPAMRGAGREPRAEEGGTPPAPPPPSPPAPSPPAPSE
jgi:type II secretion system protein N